MSMPKTPDTNNPRWNQASKGMQPELTRDNSPEQTEQHLRDSMVGRKYGLEDKRGVSATDPMETVDRTNKFISEFASAIRKLVSDQLALTNTVPDNSRVSLVNEWLGIALADEQVVHAFERMDVENASKLIEDVLLKRAIQFALHDQSLRNTSLTSAELDASIKEAEERMRQQIQQQPEYSRSFSFPLKLLTNVGAVLLAILVFGAALGKDAASPGPTPTPALVAMANPGDQDRSTLEQARQTLPTPTPDVRPTLAPAQIATATPAVRPTQAELPPQNTAEVITYTLATVIKDANIRSGPGTTYPIVGGAKTGDEFKVIGEVGDTWVKIEFVGTGTGNDEVNNDAFIHSSLVSTREINEEVKGENTGGAVNTVAESDDPGQAVDGEAAEASPYPVDVELTESEFSSKFPTEFEKLNAQLTLLPERYGRTFRYFDGPRLLVTSANGKSSELIYIDQRHPDPQFQNTWAIVDLQIGNFSLVRSLRAFGIETGLWNEDPVVDAEIKATFVGERGAFNNRISENAIGSIVLPPEDVGEFRALLEASGTDPEQLALQVWSGEPPTLLLEWLEGIVDEENYEFYFETTSSIEASSSNRIQLMLSIASALSNGEVKSIRLVGGAVTTIPAMKDIKDYSLLDFSKVGSRTDGPYFPKTPYIFDVASGELHIYIADVTNVRLFFDELLNILGRFLIDNYPENVDGALQRKNNGGIYLPQLTRLSYALFKGQNGGAYIPLFVKN